jgi:hypothetical protein
MDEVAVQIKICKRLRDLVANRHRTRHSFSYGAGHYTFKFVKTGSVLTSVEKVFILGLVVPSIPLMLLAVLAGFNNEDAL